jgi:peptidoglycan hydrolase-like amidase
VAHTGDQLYLGVVSEAMMPRFVEAARATRGEMVTYENEIVITPYFGNSNGRTKSWTQVWGGQPKPWLVSVEAEYDRARGRRQLGHGVGMSQRDASIRAEKEGIDYRAILTHYYTGVEIERVYE